MSDSLDSGRRWNIGGGSLGITNPFPNVLFDPAKIDKEIMDQQLHMAQRNKLLQDIEQSRAEIETGKSLQQQLATQLGGAGGVAAPAAVAPQGGGGAPAAALTPFVATNLPQGITPEEDQVVRTVYGEAGGESPTGQRAVASVIRNRAAASGRSAQDVIFAKSQFEPWNNPATRAKLEALDPNSPEYQKILANIRSDPTDPTGGATHFYSPTAQAKLGREPPSWGNAEPSAVIGGHNFYRIGYAPGSGAPGAPSGDTPPARGVAARTGGTDVAGPPGTVPAAPEAAPGAPAAMPGLTPPPALVGTTGLTQDQIAHYKQELTATGGKREAMMHVLDAMQTTKQHNEATARQYQQDLLQRQTADRSATTSEAHLKIAQDQAAREKLKFDQAQETARLAKLDPNQIEGKTHAEQIDRTLLTIGPKIEDGTATDAERRQYALHLQAYEAGTPQLVPDTRPGAQPGATVLANIPRTAPGMFPRPDFKPGQPAAAPAASGAQPIAGTEKAPPKGPEKLTEATVNNVASIRKIDQTLEQLDKRPQSVGLHMNIPAVIMDRQDPEGVGLRALVADIGSLKLHDRSGAAIGVAEWPRLKPFIPQITDPPGAIKAKLDNFRREYAAITRDLYDSAGPKSGYGQIPAVEEFFKREGAPSPAAEPAPAKGGGGFKYLGVKP